MLVVSFLLCRDAGLALCVSVRFCNCTALALGLDGWDVVPGLWVNPAELALFPPDDEAQGLAVALADPGGWSINGNWDIPFAGEAVGGQ